MKLTRISAFVILLFCNKLSAQKSYSTGDISNMVVGIADQAGKAIKLLGTATIIGDSVSYFILTATHVVDSIKGNCVLVFRTENDVPVVLPLAPFLKENQSKWNKHVEADIASIKISPYNKETRERLQAWSFPISQIFGEKQAIPRDFNITCFGFPVVDEINQHFSPLTFNSYFSSGLITLKRADTKTFSTFQLLENPSVQGYSGGPVFISILKQGPSYGIDRTLLVGVMHGTHSDNTGGKLAMVTPSYYIKDIIK